MYNKNFSGSDCGSVDRAVASNIRGPQFESHHQQKVLMTISSVNFIEKAKIK